MLQRTLTAIKMKNFKVPSYYRYFKLYNQFKDACLTTWTYFSIQQVVRPYLGIHQEVSVRKSTIYIVAIYIYIYTLYIYSSKESSQQPNTVHAPNTSFKVSHAT